MNHSIRVVGLDDSKETIQVPIAEAGSQGEVRQYGAIPNTPEALRKLVRRLGRPKDLHFVYEAGPCGYGSYRELRALGANCVVAAPSRTPRRPGDRIKNDRRDAATLARAHRFLVRNFSAFCREHLVAAAQAALGNSSCDCRSGKGYSVSHNRPITPSGSPSAADGGPATIKVGAVRRAVAVVINTVVTD